jgi:AcrR family transcriptional regulator
MSEPARRGRPGHDQQTVLRVAIELFNRQGYDATSMGDLARELGLTKSAIYHHVPSKEHLLELAVGQALDALESALDAVAGATPYDRLRAAVHESVIVLVRHLPAVTLLLRVHGNTPAEQEALRRRRAVDARLAAMVGAAVEQGALRDDLEPQLISRLLFGLVNSLVEWVRPGEGWAHDPDRLAAAVTTLAFDGLER